MRTVFTGVAVVLSGVLIGIACPATAAGPGPESGKSRAQLACEKACHDDHAGWVDQCIAYHDPREILPSARGQCVDAGAERLHRCLATCR